MTRPPLPGAAKGIVPHDFRSKAELFEQVPRKAAFAPVQRVIHARMGANLMSGLRPLLPEAEARREALQISALIDGLRLRLGLASNSVTPEQAIKVTLQALRRGLHNAGLCSP